MTDGIGDTFEDRLESGGSESDTWSDDTLEEESLRINDEDIDQMIGFLDKKVRNQCGKSVLIYDEMMNIAHWTVPFFQHLEHSVALVCSPRAAATVPELREVDCDVHFVDSVRDLQFLPVDPYIMIVSTALIEEEVALVIQAETLQQIADRVYINAVEALRLMEHKWGKEDRVICLISPLAPPKTRFMDETNLLADRLLSFIRERQNVHKENKSPLRLHYMQRPPPATEDEPEVSTESRGMCVVAGLDRFMEPALPLRPEQVGTRDYVDTGHATSTPPPAHHRHENVVVMDVLP